MEGLLPQKLLRARTRRGLTLRQAAEKTGVAKETISELERGLRRPHPPTLFKIAQGYNTSVDEFLTAPSEEPVLAAKKAEAPQATGRSEEELRARLEEVREVIQYALGRAEYWEQRGLEIGHKKPASRAGRHEENLTILAIDEFSSFTKWLFDGPARPLWTAMESGVGLELKDEYNALVDTLIDRIRQTQQTLFYNARNLAKTRAEKDEVAAKRQEWEKMLKDSHEQVARRIA